MFFEILMLYIIYLFLVILCTYYINLFITKEEYTKEDLTNVFPYLENFWSSILEKYQISFSALTLFFSSILGIFIPSISHHWFANSSFLVVGLYYIMPVLNRNFEEIQVTAHDSLGETILNIILKYSDIIVLGFGMGTGTILMYNWATIKEIYFLWFFINFGATCVFLGLTVKKISL